MLCVNPQHLFLGTQKDNLDDARVKGRLIDGLGARRLSDAAYRDILSAPHVRGSGVMLAARYGVTETTISRIRAGIQGSTFHNANPILNNVEPVSAAETVQLLREYFHRASQRDQSVQA
jgi:hypothetical protein